MLTVNYDTVYNLLTCDGVAGDVATSTNNIVDILGASQVRAFKKVQSFRYSNEHSYEEKQVP